MIDQSISLASLKAIIRTVPDYPKPGITFYDLTTLFKDPNHFNFVIDNLSEYINKQKVDKLVAIEARGFIIGAAIAGKMRLPFVPVRKPGKLPFDKVQVSYEKEYGQDTLELHKDAILPGERVAIVDDLVATGGTLVATCELVEQCGGIVAAIACIVALTFLPIREKLKQYPNYMILNIDRP